jgi:hypothetical protein
VFVSLKFLQGALHRLGILAGIFWSTALWAAPCDELTLIVDADTRAIAALEKARLMRSSPLRTRILREIENEKQQIEAALERLGNAQSVNTGEIERLASRLRAWEEVAEGPPVRLVPSTHHDPTSPDFRGGGSRTTIVPADAEAAFARAIPEGGTRGATWWVKVGNDYYRYQGSQVGAEIQVHWNGITSGARAIRLQDVPNTIRRSFE